MPVYNFCPMSWFPNRRQMTGYAAGATLASLIFVGWFMWSEPSPHGAPLSFGFRIGFAAIWWLTEGFALTLILMIAPWGLAVSAYGKFRRFGAFYFAAVGALLVFTLGCATTVISWKPLFIEEQTFLEGAVMAAQRQGLGFLLAGIAFGVSYWLFGERKILGRAKQS
jgi:hypothetical protein